MSAHPNFLDTVEICDKTTLENNQINSNLTANQPENPEIPSNVEQFLYTAELIDDSNIDNTENLGAICSDQQSLFSKFISKNNLDDHLVNDYYMKCRKLGIEYENPKFSETKYQSDLRKRRLEY